jgi:hypothetical protein
VHRDPDTGFFERRGLLAGPWSGVELPASRPACSRGFAERALSAASRDFLLTACLYAAGFRRDMRARGALLRHDIERLPPEVQQRFRRRAGGWAGGNGRIPLPEQGLPRRLAEGFVRAAGVRGWLGGRVVRRGDRG